MYTLYSKQKLIFGHHLNRRQYVCTRDCVRRIEIQMSSSASLACNALLDSSRAPPDRPIFQMRNSIVTCSDE